MSIRRRFLAMLLLLLATMPVAFGVGIEMGTSASMDRPGEAHGAVLADGGGLISAVSSTGHVTLGQPIYVEDETGKRAEIMLDVIKGEIQQYKAEFKPSQGVVPETEEVSARQMLEIRGADEISASAKSFNAAGDEASVDIQIGRVDACGAEFVGETDSYATADAAFAGADGRLKGSLDGVAMAGDLLDLGRDSNGGSVVCDLSMFASSTGGLESVGGEAAFRVYPGMKIQSAVDAALDGDEIDVAGGVYRENVDIYKSLTIHGTGIGRTIVDGQRNGPVFTIDSCYPEMDVSLSDMTIRNGRAEYGGGILNYGRLTLDDCMVYSNAATYGGGIANFGALTMNSGFVNHNTATTEGGGIYNQNLGLDAGYSGLPSGIIDLKGGSISFNIGSGIYNDGSNDELIYMTMDGGSISHNTGHGINNMETSRLTINGGSIDHNGEAGMNMLNRLNCIRMTAS